MRFREPDMTLWCGEDASDRDYLREVATLVYDTYTGRGRRWQLPASSPFWEISFGNRSGVFGARLNDRVSCVKLFYDERLRTKLRTMAGLSKGYWAYRNGLRLNRLGVGCPRMWGCIQQRPLGPTMIVTELIEDGLRLDHWVLENGTPRAAVLKLAQFVRGMHDKGVTHTDLSPRNILIRPRPGHYEFLLLDYEDARFRRCVSRRQRLKDLHHLHERLFHHTALRARLWFLKAYTEQDYRPYRDALARMMKDQPPHRHPGVPPQVKRPGPAQ